MVVSTSYAAITVGLAAMVSDNQCQCFLSLSLSLSSAFDFLVPIYFD
uniref:Uncharacterized protein n=1 Tax=Nelumbo nucifera TaxID=4432 RepID=A0A822ZBY8_NELNU|nr:TPA_asm: hypothetical protein HUJ06_015308 [Nelumbo nucifera]